MSVETEGFVGSREAAQRIGVSPPTLRRIVRRDGIEVFADPRDGRYRLLRAADLARLTEPRPAPPRKPTAGVAG